MEVENSTEEINPQLNTTFLSLVSLKSKLGSPINGGSMSKNFVNHFYSLFFISLFLFTSIIFAQDTKEYEETFSLDKNGSVSIDTYKGSINVETWDKAEVYFHAQVVPDDDGWNNTSPEEQLEKCEVKVDHSNSNLSLKSNYEKDFFGNSGTLAFVHYTIKMPVTAKLKVDDYKSKTKIENLNSSLRLDTYKGSVSLINFTGEIDLETYRGDVTVELSELKENCKFDTYKGEVTLEIPGSSKFDFNFDLGRKGDFSSDFDMIMNRYNSDDGEIEGRVNGSGPRITFSTYKGEIRLYKK